MQATTDFLWTSRNTFRRQLARYPSTEDSRLEGDLLPLEIGMRAPTTSRGATVSDTYQAASFRFRHGLVAPMTIELLTNRCAIIFIFCGEGRNPHGRFR